MRLLQEEHSRELNNLTTKLNQADSDMYQLERQLQHASQQQQSAGKTRRLFKINIQSHI